MENQATLEEVKRLLNSISTKIESSLPISGTPEQRMYEKWDKIEDVIIEQNRLLSEVVESLKRLDLQHLPQAPRQPAPDHRNRPSRLRKTSITREHTNENYSMRQSLDTRNTHQQEMLGGDGPTSIRQPLQGTHTQGRTGTPPDASSLKQRKSAYARIGSQGSELVKSTAALALEAAKRELLRERARAEQAHELERCDGFMLALRPIPYSKLCDHSIQSVA